MMNSHNQLQTTFLNDFSKSIKLLRSHVEGGIFTNEINVSQIASKKTYAIYTYTQCLC